MEIKQNVHKPFFYEKDKSNTIVIFIHGILESPNQFKKFAQVVYEEGYSLHAVLLDGHGKSGEDFASSSKYKWISSIDKVILKYKDRYKNIILVGHSMGALLSVQLSSKYKNRIKGLVLISTPLKVFVRPNIILSSIKIALGIIKEDDELTTYAYNAFSVDRCSLLTYIRWIPRYIDLFNLIMLTKKELRHIDIPILAIHAKKDELVSDKSIKIFNKKLRNKYEMIILEKSGHFYYKDDELVKLLNKFKMFLSEI